MCIYGVCGCAGFGMVVNAHMAEVVTEMRLEKGAGFTVERLARRAQNFVDERRNLKKMRVEG